MVLSRMRESADMTCYTAKLAERQLQEKRAAAIAAKLPSNKPEHEYPTEEELKTLPRVAGNVRWTAYTIAFVELCERFSYYGTAAVFTNFIQQPLPPNSTTGAGFSGQPGALGHGQRAATGLITFNTFWCYFTPIFGAWIADEFWGRLKTIQVSFIFAMLGHIILIVSALPPVIQHPDIAVVCFSAGLVVFGIGVGGFKSNIAPLIAEQHQRAKPYIRTNPKTGERCIVDPVQTISRIFMYFYLMINVGGLAGSISMIYAEKYIGFWLSFTIPTALFSLCPLVLFVCRHKYDVTPPTGSVIAKAFRLWAYALRPHWSWNPIRLIKNCRSPDFWGNAKPSKIRVCRRPYWMTFDDQWVDEVRRAVKACGVFAWYPVYWLAFGQMTSNLTSQAATMELHGVPNDIINNLDPLFLIITIPLMDQFIYPLISKLGFNFTPIKRIYAGYIIASLSMITATVTQHFIYVLSPCHNHASTCDKPAPISVWLQTITYILIAVSEIFTTITGYEYAYTKAPKNMKSVVQALYLMSNTVAAAAQQGLTVLSEDPLLKWNYGFVAVLAFFGGTFFYFTHRDLDDEEDYLNSLEPSTYLGREEKKKKKKGKKSKSKRRDRDLERGVQERPVERSSWSSF